MGKAGDRRWVRLGSGVLGVLVVAALVGSLTASSTRAAPPPPTCNLIPQLRDVTVNQGVGAYSPLVNGKETLVRFFLSMPSCAGSGASIQITGGTLALSGGATGAVPTPTPVPVESAYPVIASYAVAPMADSTGDPKFVVPGSLVSRANAFTANFATTLGYRSRSSKTAPYGAIQQITFSTRPGSSSPISASFDRPSNALGILFVPMGDGTKTYDTQWTAAGQQALQDGMTAGVARTYPLPNGIGNLGGTGGLRYLVAPTLLDLKRLNLLDGNGKFCGTGANYDAVKAELAQFRLSYNTANPTAQANRVVGVVDPAVGLGPPSPCFEGMAVVNSQEAWALARPGRTGQLIGLELAHTLGLTPPNRESPFDGAHSQNVTAENPSLNRRYNLVQRSFITIDRSLMKPSATSPSPDNINTLLEVPDFAFLLCVLGGTVIPECQTYGQPASVNANAPVAATLSFVMSGSTTGAAGIPANATGTASGTSVVESYFASTVPQTIPLSTSQYRLVQRSSGGTVLTNLGVPVSFAHSEHGDAPHGSHYRALLVRPPVRDDDESHRALEGRIPGRPGRCCSMRGTDPTPPQVTGLSVGGVVDFQAAPHVSNALLSTFTVINTNDGGPGSLRDAIDTANGTTGADTIDFNIPGAGAHTIQPASALPTITDPVTIDGTTQPGYAGTPIIELDGTNAGAFQDGLRISAGSSTVRGLVINRFKHDGIQLTTNGGNTIEGNYIGIDVAGTTALPNGTDPGGGNKAGVFVNNIAGNTIGGTTAAQRNVISGNHDYNVLMAGSAATGNVIRGNYVGPDAGATTGLSGFPINGILLIGSATGNTIGPSNVISGNYLGIELNAAPGNVVKGNYIGTDASVAGTTNLGNTAIGVNVIADGSTIGGTITGDRNRIAFNGRGVSVGSGVGNRILTNEIYTNGSLGIDLGSTGVTPNDAGDGDTGANDLQNFPTITSVSQPAFGQTLIEGDLASEASKTYRLEFFRSNACDSSSNGEGQFFIGTTNVTTDGSGNAPFSFTADTATGTSQQITATATDPSGNTSEFSACATIGGGWRRGHAARSRLHGEHGIRRRAGGFRLHDDRVHAARGDRRGECRIRTEHHRVRPPDGYPDQPHVRASRDHRHRRDRRHDAAER